ncbi:unnamed protein product [Auanema sp. JU1783]|nr:unnamed protein product [Auanema sp. JU1783]
MEEPACKKARHEGISECEDSEAIDGLSELEKLDPLPQTNDTDTGPSTSQAGPGSASGGAPPSFGQPTTQAPQQPSSVLQELLMHPQQTNNNSPRTGPAFSVQSQQQQNSFNTRSPMPGPNGSGNTMMSPPSTALVNSGRNSSGPGPSPGGPPGPLQQPGSNAMRAPVPNQHPNMFGPGPGGEMVNQSQYGMMQNQGAQMRGYPPNMGYPPQAPQGVPYPPAGRGQQPIRGKPGQPMLPPGNMNRQMPSGPSVMMNQMMRPHHMMDQNQFNGQFNGQPRQGQFMAAANQQWAGGRGQPYANQMMHPGQQGAQMMMMDPSQQNGPPAPQVMRQTTNLIHQQQQQPMPPQPNMSMSNGHMPPSAVSNPNQPPPNAMGVAPRGGMPNAQAPGAQDPEKRKLIQQQLVLLLHAHKCQQRERADPSRVDNAVHCNLPHCNTMKEVLQHMTSCNNGRGCLYPHCASSRQIIAHWKNCQREDCPVCKPLKSIQNNPNGSAGQTGLNEMSSLLGPNSVGSSNPGLGAAGPGSVDPLGQFGSPPSTNPNAQLPAKTLLLHDWNPGGPPSDPFRSPNPPNKNINLQGLPPSMAKGPNDFSTLDFPPPELPSTVKDWHAHVTKELRNHLVGKLVKAIFPSPDPNAIHDQRIRDLINYARKVEKEMFETANDREEYYHFLAEKIYKIQKELQEKKNSRLKPEIDLTDLEMPCPPNRAVGPSPVSANQPQQQSQPSSQWSSFPGSQQELPDNKGNIDSVSQLNSELQSNVSTPCIKEEDTKKEVSSNSSTPNLTPAATPTQNGMNFKAIKEEPCSSESSMLAVVKTEPTVKREPTPPIGEDQNFSADELRHFLLPVWEKLDSSDDAVPFRVPVDPQLLNIPDYLDIVKEPMDLLTIQTKLNSGLYTSPWGFCDDIWLMLENAWLYNRKNSKVYKFSTKLSEMFVAEMDPVMREMGYCCSRKMSFTPLALFCYGASMCTIARDQPYWVYEQSSCQFGVTVSERYTYCVKCFETLPPEGISLSENPADTTNMASKSVFIQKKNSDIDFEPFEHCKYCHRKWHRICALYDKKVYAENFTCDTCRAKKSYEKPENRFTAKKLPHNKLSSFLEDRVNGFLRSHLTNKADNYEVIIRTLCVQDKEVEVKPMMSQKYCSMGFPPKFPYRTKAIFAFEVIDGVEVCFFGLHVQEYGSNSPKPNQRRVYIAYLDSVHFFQPREYRTDVYHEILLGYLDYVKKLGYTMAHIWACPPSEGDDYIFHCHPAEQKIPKPKRLQDWYKKMLEKGVAEQTVVEFKDIYKQAKDDQLSTPMTLPYFEGDFWPNVIEDCIREASTEEENKKKIEVVEGEEEEDDLYTTSDNGKKKSTKNKKNNLKKNSKIKKKQGGSTGNEIADKLFSQFEKHKEVFFTIRLVTPQSELSLQQIPIVDPDPLMPSEMMDGRDTFLTRARDEHWEFSSLRRAKFSTLCLCHALHDTDNAKETTYCNKCSSQNAKYHCNTCEDYDLCEPCYTGLKHEHPMEQIKTLIASTEGENAGGNRYESIQRCIQSLVHACQCRDANCRRMSCHKMKRVVQHTKMCKKRVSASCPVCKQLIALCCYHAKHCSRDSCSVPFCMNIRQKLAEQKRSISRRADMMMRRRMEGLQAGGGSVNSGNPAPAGNVNVSTPPTTSKPEAAVSSKVGK